MDWGIIIAGVALLIAVYGAGLATWQGMKSRHQQESRLRVTIAKQPSSDPGVYSILIDIANPTLRQVTVAEAEIVTEGARGPNIRVLPERDAPQYPVPLEPGAKCTLEYPSDLIGFQFRLKSVTGKQSIRAQAQDGLGNTFRSEPISITVVDAVPK